MQQCVLGLFFCALFSKNLDRFLEEEAKVGRKVVDVKNGKIRIFDTPKTLHCSLRLDDLGLTEQEAIDSFKPKSETLLPAIFSKQLAQRMPSLKTTPRFMF